MSHAIRRDDRQQYLLPPSIDDWVPKEHPVRFVRDLIDSLKLEELGIYENPEEQGRPHYAAELLLGVWVYGYMERIRSTRALERACLRDLAFIWLTGNNHPDHLTLWRFFRAHKPALRKLFKQVVRVAVNAGLVGFALHALDGTKISASSSMDTAEHREALKDRLKHLDKLVNQHLAATEAGEEHDRESYALPPEMRDPKKRREAILQSLRVLDQADTDHLHRAEPDARAVKTRAGVVMGYNAQAMVDHDSDLIVAADVVGEETDNAQLVPMLAQTLETTGRVAEATVADAGYASGEQFDEAERRRLPIIVDTTPPPKDAGEFHKSHFKFDEERNVYICPRGEALTFQFTERPSAGGKAYPRDVYRCRKQDCPVQSQCTKDRQGRAIKRSPYEPAFDRQVANRKNPVTRVLLSLRKEIVEHIFGLAKTRDSFRRFTIRGLDAARTQWLLACTAINLRKLYPWWRAGTLRLAR